MDPSICRRTWSQDSVRWDMRQMESIITSIPPVTLIPSRCGRRYELKSGQALCARIWEAKGCSKRDTEIAFRRPFCSERAVSRSPAEVLSTRGRLCSLAIQVEKFGTLIEAIMTGHTLPERRRSRHTISASRSAGVHPLGCAADIENVKFE